MPLSGLADVREIRDDHERRSAIAIDYARLPEEERARTLVVAGTNEARREINRAIREDLGLAGEGREFATLVRRDTTQAERTFAKNYAVGDIIQPECDYPRVGLARVIEFNPMNSRRLSVYEPERTEFAPGDRVRITRNDATLDLANGDRFTVAAASPGS